jgi:AAA domain, putative AbiEii toxin, Type IV TA system/AAA ATPase domain
MLSSIHLEGFKGFRDTTVGPLRKVNLIVGGQNMGKTSLLEAVDMVLFGNSTKFRPNEGSDWNRFLASTLNAEKLKKLEFRTNDGNLRGFCTTQTLVPVGMSQYHIGHFYGYQTLHNTISTAASIPLYLPQQLELVHLFGQLVVARKKRDLTQMLRQIEPRLESLDAVAPDGEQRIYAELTGIDQALPLPALGHGFARLLYLFSTLLSTDAKLALIDEVENGIHYSALPTLLQGIKNVAHDRDVQTIMTTHSMDCIKAASKVFEDSPDDFQVIRLVRTADNIEADIIPADAVQAVLEHNGEVR